VMLHDAVEEITITYHIQLFPKEVSSVCESVLEGTQNEAIISGTFNQNFIHFELTSKRINTQHKLIHDIIN
jgi:hypothetical protein